MPLTGLDAVAFTHRSALLVAAAAPLVWAGLAAPAPGAPELAGGLTLASGGVALRLASVRWLGKRARVSRAKATELVACGPYAHVRNPLYVAAVLMIVGLGLMTGLGAWAVLPAAWALLVYDRAVRHEERVLLVSHGESAGAYLRRVPRWLPRLTKVAAGPSIDREAWGQVLRREWRLLVGMPAALAGLVLLALPPVGDPVRALAASIAATVGLPLHALVGAIAVLAAAGNVLKTRYDLARKARRRALEETSVLCLAAAGSDQAAS